MPNAPESTDSARTSSFNTSDNLVRETHPEERSAQEVIAERDRLRKDLAEAQDEVLRLRCQTEMLRQEWFSAKRQEEEYRRCIKKLIGVDPYIHPQEILAADRDGQTLADFITELEQEAGSEQPGGANG